MLAAPGKTLQQVRYTAEDATSSGAPLEEFVALNDEEARDYVEAWQRDAYDPDENTLYVYANLYRGTAAQVEDGEAEEVDSITVAIDPMPPVCEDGNLDTHDWQNDERRAVYGNGGGVVIHDICTLCGSLRRTDTWAQGPSGEQGLTSISYPVADAV